MNLDQVILKFRENPKNMEMGSGKLSARFKCTKEDIFKAREIVRGENIKVDRVKNVGPGTPILQKSIRFNKLDRISTPSRLEGNTVGMHIIQGCVHVPFQNKKMQVGIMNLMKDLGDKVKGFHLIGDILDMNSLSAHDNNKLPIPGITLGYEYKEGNKFLDEYDTVIPATAMKTYLYGNHEDRWNRHVADVNNSKYADAVPSPREALRLEERGYIVKDNWKEDYFILGKDLQIIHGEFCTKYPARTHVDRMKASVIFAHTHRIDINYDGEKAGFNIGWGGDTNAAAFNYVSRLTKMNWINGFAIVHIDNRGNYFTQVIPVFHNEFWYNGIRYGG